MSKKEYIYSGKCIWCKKCKPDVSFSTAPHIVPHSIGASEIGFDICDDCNNFFGKASKGMPLNTNLVFKEVFNASKHSLGNRPKEKQKYSSAYFFYERTSGRIKLKRALSVSRFTEQFKRSLFEAFLQKYHHTYPDEPLDKFEAVRKYARYGIGSLHVYYIHNKVIFHSSDEKEDATLHMGDKAREEINNTGYFTFIFMGHILFLEVLPITASIGGIKVLQEIANPYIIPLDGTEGLYELADFRHLDMFFERLASKNIDTNNLLYR